MRQVADNIQTIGANGTLPSLKNNRTTPALRTKHSTQLVDDILYTTEQYTEQQIVICDVTGINISMNIPSIYGKCYNYKNPLADYKNVIELSKIQYQLLVTKYDSHILAGAFLSALTHWHLLSDKLSAVQRNMLLQDASPVILIDAISFICSLSKRQASWLPQISFAVAQSDPSKISTIEDITKNYIKECKAIVNPKQDEYEETATALQDSRDYAAKILMQSAMMSREKNRVPDNIIIRENKDNFKLLLIELVAEDIASKKLITMLRMLSQGSNLYTLHQEIRVKFVSALLKLENDVANEIIAIINHNVYNKAKEIVMGKEISTQAEFQPKIKPTLAQIIAARKRNLDPSVVMYEELAAKQALNGADQPSMIVDTAQIEVTEIELETEQEILADELEESIEDKYDAISEPDAYQISEDDKLWFSDTKELTGEIGEDDVHF